MRRTTDDGPISRDARAGSHRKALTERGWCRFDYDPELAGWIDRVLPAARNAVADAANARWLRCGGTWFAGVNVLDNDGNGAIADSGPLRGPIPPIWCRTGGSGTIRVPSAGR